MKVCIPTMGKRGIEEDIGTHFGMAPTYTMVDTDTNEVTIIDNTSDHMGGIGHPPEIIAKTGAEVMLCGGLGSRAIMLFMQLGIQVFVGASGTVKDTIQLWRDGKLEQAFDAADSTCDHHDCGSDHNHGHHH